jgi:hypothetical protein
MQLGAEEQLDVFADWMLWTLAACLILSIGIVLGIVIEKLSFRRPAKEIVTHIPTQVETNTNPTPKAFATSIHSLPAANPVALDPSKVSNTMTFHIPLSNNFATGTKTYRCDHGW